VMCVNFGDCALTWQYSSTNHFYSCADVYVLSRNNDAIITFSVNRGNAAVPTANNLLDRFTEYFSAKYGGSFANYNIRGPSSDPTADGGGNFGATFTLSDGIPMNQVNAQNMSNQVQFEVNNNGVAVANSIFGTTSRINGLDVNDSYTRSKAPSTSSTAIAVIVVFLILTAILLGVWYYSWKYHPQKLRACMERACPCFMGHGSSSSSSSSSSSTTASKPYSGGGPRAPASAPPARPQITI